MSGPENAGGDGTDSFPGREPIGFSDLEPDEALLVSLFRGWRHGAPTAAIAAHVLAIRLRSINYHQYTELLLNVFKSIGPSGCGHPERIGYPLLAPEEERLIGHVAALADRERPFSVRPVEAIARSGQDRLEMAIARSYRLVQAGF